MPAEVYPLTEARAAFRRMQQARHIGKIVVQMPKPLQPRGDRSYLITGGLGAIGLHTAAYLAQLGAGDIVLTSRRAPDADAQRAIDDITERYKCRIHVFAADVGEEAEVAKLLERIRAELPPLAGVAHLAGVLDDALMSQQSPERFRTTLAPKAFGAYHLDRLTKNDELEFFIVYSSVSSVFGSPGQANYATANALLDGLVAQRRAQGLPATGVNLGPWAQGGMASSDAATRQSQCARPDSAGSLGRLERARRDGRQRTGQATVIKANWQRAAKVLGGTRPWILDHVLPSAVAARYRRQRVAPATAWRSRCAAGRFRHRIPAARGTEFPAAAQPPAATSRFLELGTDSLMAVEFATGCTASSAARSRSARPRCSTTPPSGGSPSTWPVRCRSYRSTPAANPNLPIRCRINIRHSRLVEATKWTTTAIPRCTLNQTLQCRSTWPTTYSPRRPAVGAASTIC